MIIINHICVAVVVYFNPNPLKEVKKFFTKRDKTGWVRAANVYNTTSYTAPVQGGKCRDAPFCPSNESSCSIFESTGDDGMSPDWDLSKVHYNSEGISRQMHAYPFCKPAVERRDNTELNAWLLSICYIHLIQLRVIGGAGASQRDIWDKQQSTLTPRVYCRVTN